MTREAHWLNFIYLFEYIYFIYNFEPWNSTSNVETSFSALGTCHYIYTITFNHWERN